MHAAGPSPWPTTSPAVLPSAIPDHELLCLIGRGAYGEVWMARNAIGTLRAVKIVHRQSFQRVEHFEREFKGLLKFEPISRSHDGLVDILQIGRRDDAGYFFYVMELADAVQLQSLGTQAGETENVNLPRPTPQLVSETSLDAYIPRTLRSELHQRGRLPVAECVTVGAKLASALRHLHHSGLVHRDIKPSNIIFVKGEPKLADIGLVTAIDDAHSLVGTAGYIPPEGPGTPQADLYSLGKVLYEIAFGKDRQDFPQLPPDLQSHHDYTALLELNEVILKACETDPTRRYASASALERDLSLLQNGVSVRQNRKHAKRWAIARKCILAGTIVGLLIATSLVFQSVGREYKPKPEAERLYKLGQWHYNKLTPHDHKKAMQYLRRATEIDPHFVLPYRELIALYVWGKAGLFSDDEEKTRELRQIADKLLTMNSKLAEGHTALSWWHFLNGNVRAAEGEIVRAIDLDPDYSIARDVYTYYLCMLGCPDDAHRQAQRAQELDPTARTSGVVAAWPFFAARKFDKAITQLQRVLELEKDFPEALNFLARCYEAQSNYVEAIETWKMSDLMTCQNSNRVIAGYTALRQAFERDGERGYLQQYIELIREDESLPEEDQVFFVVDVAGYYARLGQNERALDEIENHFDKPNVRAQLKFEPFYDALHDHPRFKALLKRAGIEP